MRNKAVKKGGLPLFFIFWRAPLFSERVGLLHSQFFHVVTKCAQTMRQSLTRCANYVSSIQYVDFLYVKNAQVFLERFLLAFTNVYN